MKRLTVIEADMVRVIECQVPVPMETTRQSWKWSITTIRLTDISAPLQTRNFLCHQFWLC